MIRADLLGAIGYLHRNHVDVLDTKIRRLRPVIEIKQPTPSLAKRAVKMINRSQSRFSEGGAAIFCGCIIYWR